MKTLLIGCFGLIVGLLVGIAFTMLGSNASSKPAPIAPSARSARPELAITASAPFVSSQLQQALRANGIVKNAIVTLATPNLIRIVASTDVKVLGFQITLDANVAMRLSVQNGRIVLKTDSVDMGGFPVPQGTLDSTVEQLRAQAEDQMNRVAQSALRGTNLRVSDIRMTENDMTVELSGQ